MGFILKNHSAFYILFPKKHDDVTRAAYVKNKTLPVSLILYAALLDQEIRWKTKKTLKNTIKAHSFDSFDWSQTNQKSFSFNHPRPIPPSLPYPEGGYKRLAISGFGDRERCSFSSVSFSWQLASQLFNKETATQSNRFVERFV